MSYLLKHMAMYGKDCMVEDMILRKLIPIGNGRVRIGKEEIQFLPPECRDNVFPIEVLKTYESLLGLIRWFYYRRLVMVSSMSILMKS
jgi:hypothetical protein